MFYICLIIDTLYLHHTIRTRKLISFTFLQNPYTTSSAECLYCSGICHFYNFHRQSSMVIENPRLHPSDMGHRIGCTQKISNVQKPQKPTHITKILVTCTTKPKRPMERPVHGYVLSDSVYSQLFCLQI